MLFMFTLCSTRGFLLSKHLLYVVSIIYNIYSKLFHIELFPLLEKFGGQFHISTTEFTASIERGWGLPQTYTVKVGKEFLLNLNSLSRPPWLHCPYTFADCSLGPCEVAFICLLPSTSEMPTLVMCIERHYPWLYKLQKAEIQLGWAQVEKGICCIKSL